MKPSTPLLSVVVTTYNRYDSLKRVLANIYDQSYKNIEVIVSDDCSSDQTKKIQNDFPDIRYIKTPENLGYAKNSKFALSHANGEYIVFISDDDEIVENDYFKIAVESLQKSDMFIARSATRFNGKLFKKEYSFQRNYTQKEFFRFLQDIHYYYIDFFSFSSCVFKRELFLQIEPFETAFDFACDVDTASIFKYLQKAKTVSFFDKVVYVWERPSDASLSGSSKKDLALHTLEMIASALNIRKNLSDEIYQTHYNGYVKYAFDAVLSDYHSTNNERYFQNLLKKIPKQIYIYGSGATGQDLSGFLNKNGINVLGFIDDFRHGDDIVSFRSFAQKPQDVVIASYKYRDIYKIYKKLAKFDINIYDLFGDDDQC